MKILISILSAIILVGTASTNVIACNNQSLENYLSDKIKNSDLGSIYTGQLNQPNKSQILEAIKTKNVSANELTENDFEFKNNPSATNVTINGIGKYKGKITLNYQINNFKIITKTKFSGDIYRMLWTNDNTLYIGLINWNNEKISNILLKSIDGGKTFKPIENVIGVQINSIINDENKTLWVATDRGLYKSTNGISFDKVLNDNVCSLTTDNEKNIWVGTNDGVLYKSSFIKIEFKEIKKFNGKISNLAFISNSKILYVGIAISGYSGNGELYTSTDGISFQKNSKINNEVTAITISSNGTIYIGTYKSYSKGNLYKSTDGINFIIVNKINNSVFSLVADNNNNIYIGTELGIQKGKIFKLDNQSDLKEIFGVLTTAWCLTIDNKKNIYAGTGRAGKYISSIYQSEFINS
ncbi:two-component regulator propeller domain-containing protein [Spiroplasma ixodetis]|uniref:two-component regulator propeller domain-containing protein n=2 Tax=Bacteria TaxID=2 RepID=UPI0025753F5E|nr:two-component regulator propeller domain-containing protein [Spiroplasma ixodetis]WJG71315.1 hypothetical protein SIXOD_v1c27150 [Spiroplasma ixodetis Y32]